MNKVIIIKGDDWLVCFKDNVYQFQSHSIDINDFKDLCPINSIKKITLNDKQTKLLEENGSFPNSLEDIKIMFNLKIK